MARILGIQKELAAKEMKADISFADSRKDNPANMTMSKNTLTWVFTILCNAAIALRNFTVIEQRWNANLHPQSHDCVNWRCHMISAATTTLASRPRLPRGSAVC